MNRTDMKEHAQNNLMHGIANVLGYWEEDFSKHPDGWEKWSEKDQEIYRIILLRQADRVARLFGFEEAWGN